MDAPSLLDALLAAADAVIDDEPPPAPEDDEPYFPNTYCGVDFCAAHAQEPYL